MRSLLSENKQDSLFQNLLGELRASRSLNRQLFLELHKAKMELYKIKQEVSSLQPGVISGCSNTSAFEDRVSILILDRSGEGTAVEEATAAAGNQAALLLPERQRQLQGNRHGKVHVWFCRCPSLFECFTSLANPI